MDAPQTWVQVAEELGCAPRPVLAVVIGGTDTGKTALCVFLANALRERNLRVALVDADMGQSDIGPPSTIGMGFVEKPIASPAEVPCLASYFVGSTTPVGLLLPTVIGAKKMSDAPMRLGADAVLVDTTGLVHGGLGRELKARKVELLAPRFVLALQRESEIEHILRLWSPPTGLPDSARPQVRRLEVSPRARDKSREFRQATREARLAAHFARAKSVTIPLSQVALWGTAFHAGKRLTREEAGKFEGLLVGLLAEDESLLGLGRVEEVHSLRRHLRVLTPVADAGAVKRVVFGLLRLDRQGREAGKVRAGEI